MPSFQRSRLPGLLLNVIALATTLVSIARAQTPTVETASAAPTHDAVRLDKYVVSASRTAQDLKYTPSAISVMMPDELAASQVIDLKTALSAQPGVIVVSTGARGGQTSIFMRGANSDQVLIMVDGVRMNSSDAPYTNFLAGADLAGLDRIEVLRGPQSTLYGSSAMGGVISMETARGCGVAQGRIAGVAGSFDTFGGLVAVSGGNSTVGASLSLSRDTTENDRPDNQYARTAYSTRLEWAPMDTGLLFGVTLRGQCGKYNEAGPEPLGFSSKGEVVTPNHLLTTYAQWSMKDMLRSRLTAGWHQSEYQWTDKTYGPSSNYYYRNTRRILDWQNSWQASEEITVVAGANAEWSHYNVSGKQLEDSQRGLYANADYRLFDALTLNLGARTDSHELDGRANTWRSGASYRIAKTNTKLRATYGTGFKAPTMTNRFGMPPWYGESPTIKAEESQGWDVGFDQEFGAGRFTASATYFHNHFDDLIDNVFSMSTFKYVATNIKDAKTEGVEVALGAQVFSSLKLRATYTYLDAYDTSNALKVYRLIRRPRHTGDFDAQWQVLKSWQLGAGFHFVSDRLASSTASKSVRQEDYTTARLYTSFELRPQLYLKLRVENALDEEYAEVVGYPALPRGVFGAVEWKF
jgi:vitamin B12 transporter